MSRALPRNSSPSSAHLPISTKLATVGKDASVLRAAAIMRQHHVHDLVVIERKYGGWAPAGVITEHDIVIEVVGQGLDPMLFT